MSPTDHTPGSTPDPADEIEQLRAEVQALKRERESRPSRWGRGAGAVVLLVLAGLLLPSAATAVWADRLIGNTDRYVQTVAPLAEDPEMQAAIAARITAEIDKYVDVEDLTLRTLTALGRENGPLDGELADRLKSLAGPIANGVNGFVEDQVRTFVASPQFAEAWDRANGIAHQQLVTALTGKDDGAVQISQDGAVRVDLGEFVALVKQRLVDSGFALASAIPAVDAQLVLFQSDDLSSLQRAFRTLDTFGWLLPLIVLVLLVGGVLLAPSWRVGLIGAGLAVAIAGLVSLAALSVGRIIYLENIPTDVLPGGAAGSAFDILTRFLEQGLRTLAAFGVIAVVVGLLAGPARGAVAVRGWWVGGLQGLNHWARSIGARTEPAAGWVESNALLLRIIVAVAGIATLLLWDYPTPRVALWLTLAVLVGLAVIDFLRAPVRPEDRADTGSTGRPATA